MDSKAVVFGAQELLDQYLKDQIDRATFDRRLAELELLNSNRHQETNELPDNHHLRINMTFIVMGIAFAVWCALVYFDIHNSFAFWLSIIVFVVAGLFNSRYLRQNKKYYDEVEIVMPLLNQSLYKPVFQFLRDGIDGKTPIGHSVRDSILHLISDGIPFHEAKERVYLILRSFSRSQ
jgi:hypothetical protein